MRLLFLAALLLLPGCDVNYPSDLSGTVPLALEKRDQQVWVATFWRQAASDSKPSKEEFRIFSSNVGTPSDVNLSKAVNIQGADPWGSFVAGLDFVESEPEPRLWALGQFRGGRALKVFSSRGEQSWAVPANVPDVFNHFSLSVTHLSTIRTWVWLKGSLNHSQGGLFEIDESGLQFLSNVIWARCRQDSCQFARQQDGRLIVYALGIQEKFTDAYIVRERAIGTVAAVCRDQENHDRLLAGGSSFPLETTGPVIPIPELNELPADPELFCGPSNEKASYWLAISPNSSNTFMVDTSKGMTTTDVHFDNNSYYAVVATDDGWLLAEGKHLGTTRRGQTCDAGFPMKCEEIDDEHFGLKIRAIGIDGSVK